MADSSDLINSETQELSLKDVNWLYQFFTTADNDGDFEVQTADLIDNIRAGPEQKDKLAYFFSYIDADGSGTIDFSEWLNWGAQDGRELLDRIGGEKGLSEEDLRDPDAEIPCGEERLAAIKEAMEESGDIECGEERERSSRDRYGGKKGGCRR